MSEHNWASRLDARNIIGSLLALVPAAVIVTTLIAWWHRLPSTVPIQWGAGGAVTNTLPVIALSVLALVLALAAACFSIAAIAAPALGLPPRRATMIALAVGGLFSGLWVFSAVTQVFPGLEAGRWALAILLGAAWGPIVGALVHGEPDSGRPAAPEQPGDALRLDEGERAAWIGTTGSPVFMGLAGLLGLAAISMWLVPVVNGWSAEIIITAAVFTLACLIVLITSRVSVSIDRRGVRATGTLGVPLRRIPLAQIRSAVDQVLEPGDWGGWGYRFTGGRSAIIFRRGPGLLVTKDNGTQFAISMDSPKEPAQLLTALIGSRSRES